MKHLFTLTSILLFAVILKAQTEVPEQNNKDNALYTKLDIITDSRDAQQYQIVQIGTQIWMAENMNYDDGKSWCYQDSSFYCDTYGRLYNWESANNICPTGWHLPSDKEWEILAKNISIQMDYLVKTDGDWGSVNWLDMGIYLKSTSGWYLNANGTDTFGFNALPGGMRNIRDGSYSSVNQSGYWWSSTEQNKTLAFRRHLYYSYNHFGNYDVNKELGHSVRCIKN